MNVVGVDLAWSASGQGLTGLCAVHGRRVVASAVVRSDDEIVSWLAPFLAGEPWLLALDAPLIVRNRSGRRSCERLVSSLFGRYHAGAHSSNRGMPAFRDGARAARLADRLGAEIAVGDPPPARHRAIEVYPHPALVTLFRLERTLTYKAKPGRTVDHRRGELVRLMGLVETLEQAWPPLDVRTSERWSLLAQAVDDARSQAALDRAEDELDAYVCAYVGLFHLEHGAPWSHVFGDLESGFIVVPLAAPAEPLVPHEVAGRLPSGATPSPRPPAHSRPAATSTASRCS